MKKQLYEVELLIGALTMIVGCSVASPIASNDHAAASAQGSKSNDGNQTASKTLARTIRFSGFDWIVKSSSDRVGPGPNYFSDSEDNVRVDPQGRLHLRITRRDDRWNCAEVVSKKSFGYGAYRFYLDPLPDDMNPKVVLGLFTWNDNPAFHHREIDVEISKWGRAVNQNAQFVVQPYANRDNIHRFMIPPQTKETIQSFIWKKDRVFFLSAKGSVADPSDNRLVIQRWSGTHQIPEAGGENARLNLWLMSEPKPEDRKETEIVIDRFEFINSADK